MSNEQSIVPLTIVGASLVMQYALMAIFAVTLAIYKSESKLTSLEEYFKGKSISQTPILICLIITTGILLITDEMSTIWKPLFGGFEGVTISAVNSILLMFIFDAILLLSLIIATGGGGRSPFVTALFSIAPLAIFLRMPPRDFLILTILTIFIYIFSLIQSRRIGDFGTNRDLSQSAIVFMNMACLIVSIVTGFVTRSVPLDQLPHKIEAQITSP